MKPTTLHFAALGAAATLACATSAPVIVQAAAPGKAQQPPRALPADFDLLVGPLWRGTLTYLDYTSHQPVSIKSTLSVTRLAGDDPRWDLRLGYDDEPHANKGDTAALTEGGRLFDGALVTEREVLAGGAVRVVTESDGEDDNKPARLRHVYTMGPAAASLQKLVRYGGAGEFIERNIYRWTR